MRELGAALHIALHVQVCSAYQYDSCQIQLCHREMQQVSANHVTASYAQMSAAEQSITHQASP